MIIGTPGTLLDWILRYRRFDTKKISIFVLDEADVMISTQGHQDQSTRIKKYSHFNDIFLTFADVYLVYYTGRKEDRSKALMRKDDKVRRV